jgi:hypothetical protein
MGLPTPLVVPQQALPDASFPTTPVPNPEDGEGVWMLAHDVGVLFTLNASLGWWSKH